ncbi:MAG: hypothetical protein GY833_10845 [Aestuariibacter sp.]|nr:hypothetical protein [Aestuariibacter sp.]
MSLFSYFKHKISHQVFAKSQVTFAVYADDVEYIVARSTRDITSKKALKEAINAHLFDYGYNFEDDLISDYPVEVAAAKENARVTVQKFMPELYMGGKS